MKGSVGLLQLHDRGNGWMNIFQTTAKYKKHSDKTKFHQQSVICHLLTVSLLI